MVPDSRQRRGSSQAQREQQAHPRRILQTICCRLAGWCGAVLVFLSAPGGLASAQLASQLQFTADQQSRRFPQRTRPVHPRPTVHCIASLHNSMPELQSWKQLPILCGDRNCVPQCLRKSTASRFAFCALVSTERTNGKGNLNYFER